MTETMGKEAGKGEIRVAQALSPGFNGRRAQGVPAASRSRPDVGESGGSEDNTVICELCPNRCRIGHGQAGNCRVRINVKGTLHAVTFGRPCAVAVDPIEKKPLFHVIPGSKIMSVATAGCNLHCRNCQNHSISQADPEKIERVVSWSRTEYGLSPQRLVQICRKRSIPSIAFTYTEPTVFYEYTYETAELARQNGIKTVTVTAGYINRKPLVRLCKVIDASNVDLKTMRPGFFRENSGGELKYVLDGLVTAREQGIHVEITNLVIPTLNDSTSEMKDLCRWIVSNMGKETPLHFSRFYPHHQLRNLPPTPPSTLARARKIALDAGLSYVYVGNLRGNDAESTFCPACRRRIIGRVGYTITSFDMDKGKCRFCGHPVPGIWK